MASSQQMLFGIRGASLPVNVVSPGITGTAQVGQTLSVSNGTWTGTTPITFTYQWQRVTTNISGATSSSYTLVAADVGNKIRCVVTATNAAASVNATTASTSSVVPLIGEAFGGGFFAGQISTSANGVATHNLVVGARSSAASNEQFYNDSISYPPNEPNSLIDGPSNTAKMIAQGGSAAATFCNNLVLGGFSDWYLGAPNEMKVVYTNLKPTTANNQTTAGANVQGNNLAGINPNAVPARTTTYTTGSPAQTSAAAFQAGGAEAFLVSPFQFYWVSYIGNPDRGDAVQASPPNSGNALSIAFTYGGANFAGLTQSTRLRAIRRVAV